MFTCTRGGGGGGGGGGGLRGEGGGKEEQEVKLWQLRRMELRWRQQLHSLTWDCDEDDGDGDYGGDEEEGNSDGARACIDVDDDDDNDDDKKDEDGVAVRQQLVVKMAGGVSQASTNTLSTTAGQLFFLSACRAFNWQQIDK